MEYPNSFLCRKEISKIKALKNDREGEPSKSIFCDIKISREAVSVV